MGLGDIFRLTTEAWTEMTPLFTWSGKYVGFIADGRIFDARSNYRGWIEESHAWNGDGTYLGEVVDVHYILRNTLTVKPMPKMPRMPPMPPMPPLPSMPQVSRIPRVGWIDALE